MTKTQLISLVATNINDNTNGEISPQDVRDCFNAIFDNYLHISDASIGTFSGGFWYAGNPTTPLEGDQRQRVNAGKFIIEEYVSGSWTSKFEF